MFNAFKETILCAIQYRRLMDHKMDDILLLETIERYLAKELSSSELSQFEAIRKNTPEIDQMVVEHEHFLREMASFSNRKQFTKLSNSIFNQLDQEGYFSQTEESNQFKIIQLWTKYKRVSAIAAIFVVGLTIITSVIVQSLTPTLNGDQIMQLSKAVEGIKKEQQAHLLNEAKTKVPENAKMLSGGSGFLIDAKGYVVTNAHVLKGKKVVVVNNAGQELTADIIYTDKNLDLALLAIHDDEYKQPKNLPFGISKSIDLGEEVFTLGYPRADNDIVYGKGYLSAESGFDGDSNTYQIQISANPGISGSPVFNDNGQLVGIVSARQKQMEGVAFAIKSKKVVELIEAAKEANEAMHLNIKLNASKYNRGDRKTQIKNIKDYIYNIKSFN